MVRGIRLDQPTRTALFGATKMLKDRGLPDVARFALQRLQPDQQAAPVVVVVGEVKRGKSSLVNALIGHPGLSPVSVDVATNSFIRFTPPTDTFEADTARAILPGERKPIALSRIAQWASVGGEHAEPTGDEPLVRGVEVAVDARYLPGVEIIDTPGVGGLTSSHAEVSKHSASWASVLLFVCDCGQPLTSNELAFLADLSATVDGVVLAMTKKDLYPSGWREILAENRRLLRQHAPRFAEVEIFAVSSVLADKAATLEVPATKEALLVASGVPELGRALSERAGNAEQTSIANALRTVRTGLDQVLAQLQLRRQAAAGSPELLADLNEERARLERLSSQQSRWNLDLDRDMGAIRSTAVGNATREFAQIRDRWTVLISKDKKAATARGRQELMGQVSFELDTAAGRVANQLYQHLYQMVHKLFEEATSAQGVYQAVNFELGRLHPPPRPLRPSGVSKLDPSLVTTAFFGVSMATSAAHLAGISVLLPFALPLAGGWLAINMTYRVIKGGRTQMQTWMQESIQALQQELISTTDNVIRDFRPEVVVAFREYLATATAQVKASIREAEQAAAASRKEREQRIGAIDRHIEAVQSQRAEVDRALVAVASMTADDLTGGTARSVLSPARVAAPAAPVPPAPVPLAPVPPAPVPPAPVPPPARAGFGSGAAGHPQHRVDPVSPVPVSPVVSPVSVSPVPVSPVPVSPVPGSPVPGPTASSTAASSTAASGTAASGTAASGTAAPSSAAPGRPPLAVPASAAGTSSPADDRGSRPGPSRPVASSSDSGGGLPLAAGEPSAAPAPPLAAGSSSDVTRPEIVPPTLRARVPRLPPRPRQSVAGDPAADSPRPD